jgi:hypothetical protein
MFSIQVNVLQKLCGQMGARQSSRLTKHEAVQFLRKKLDVPEHFKKIFTKIWGASGKVRLQLVQRITIYKMLDEI